MPQTDSNCQALTSLVIMAEKCLIPAHNIPQRVDRDKYKCIEHVCCLPPQAHVFVP